MSSVACYGLCVLCVQSPKYGFSGVGERWGNILITQQVDTKRRDVSFSESVNVKFDFLIANDLF